MVPTYQSLGRGRITHGQSTVYYAVMGSLGTTINDINTRRQTAQIKAKDPCVVGCTTSYRRTIRIEAMAIWLKIDGKAVVVGEPSFREGSGLQLGGSGRMCSAECDSQHRSRNLQETAWGGHL